MQSPIANRKFLLRAAAHALTHFEKRAAAEGVALETPHALSPDGAISSLISSALEWAEAEGAAAGADTLESISTGDGAPYMPTNRVLSLLQSAYDEHAATRAGAAGTLEIPFDTTDLGWLTVAFEKLKAALRGKRKFIKHTTLESFRYTLPENAVVALFSDWGTGEPTAERVMQQIRAANPTHAIHLGDVYYSGTPHEVQTRFLDAIERAGPPRASCRYFSLNSNHEMYSGGYGYFDKTLPAFGQDASYFNLGNQFWQLIGLDSGYEDFGLQDPQQEWLTAQLNRPNPKSILLSHHQLFSPYEARSQDKPLFHKTAALLPKVTAWFWGHEHKCIILKDHLGVKGRCIGHGAIPSNVPYGAPQFPDVPIEKVDERRSPDGTNVHGFALLRFSGSRLDVSYIDEFGSVFHTERLDVGGTESVFVPGPRAEPAVAPGAASARFRRLLSSRDSLGGGGVESVEGMGDPEPDLSSSGINDRVGGAGGELHDIVKKHLGDRPDLHEIVDQMMADGRASLERLAGGEEIGSDHAVALEVIVKSDGSRPSFMVRNGKVDLTTSPAGVWSRQVDDSAQKLEKALSCVGRIELPGGPQGFAGTGFLIQENLIVTNRHVLQAVARADSQGVWKFLPGVAIDFGHEFKARESITPRRLKSVAFHGQRQIAGGIDHTKLDLVLIELDPAAEKPPTVLGFDISPDWAQAGRFTYVSGYPGNPGLEEPLSLLEQLFQSTFGCKRLAPGEVLAPHSGLAPWTVPHDATTLGGNSGSVVLIAGREGAAAGLHYGGTRAAPRENWGHVLGLTLGEPDKLSGKTLREVLNAFGVNLV